MPLFLSVNAEGSCDKLHCDEGIFLGRVRVRNALVVVSPFERVLLLVTVLLLPDQLLDVLSSIHRFSVEEICRLAVCLLAEAREEAANCLVGADVEA